MPCLLNHPGLWVISSTCLVLPPGFQEKFGMSTNTACLLLSTKEYSLVPIRRHGSINRHTSFIWPCTFPKIWGVTINWINTQFWSTSRGTFDKNNSAPIAYTFEGVSFNWIMTFSMPWGVTINWNMSSNWNQRVKELCSCKSTPGRNFRGKPRDLYSRPRSIGLFYY